jgi:hypothetical protein
MKPKKERAIRVQTQKSQPSRIIKDGKTSLFSRQKNDGVLLLH